MKRSAPVVWSVLALLSAGLLLLADPFAWFPEKGPSEPLAPSTPGDAAQDAGVTPRSGHQVIADAPATVPDGTIDRQAVDRLVEGELAAFGIVAASGQPVVGAQVLVERNGQLLCDQHSDADGEVELAADARPATLYVAVEHRPLERRDVVLDVGRQEILLAEGSCLSGRFVTEDGLSPGQLRITVDADHSLSADGPPPAVVVQALSVVEALRSAYSIVSTDQEGGFEFTGLLESWSGRLRLRGGWTVASSTHGDILPFARGIRLSAPSQGVVVRLAPQRTLHGRLVLRDDLSPLDGARLSTMLRSPDTDSPIFSGATTDETGYFEIEVRPERISSFEVHLGARFRECPAILVLDGARIPVDGDLGDVVVDEVRHVPFRLQDANGEPVARGVAVAAGTRSPKTGRDGLGELRWLARSVTHLVAEAPGFVPTEREIPPIVTDPLVVSLEPANELVVSLLLPAGADPSQFKVVLHGEERITAAPVTDRLGQHRHVSKWSYPTVRLWQAAPDTFLCADPDAEGHVTFRALRPGVGIELRVCGITGGMVYHAQAVAPLAPAERRELEVSLEDGMIVFRGRVLDQEGAPLSRASLQLGGQILGWTDDEGALLCYLATPDTGTLLIQHRACSTRYLPDYQVPTHGRPVEFRLSAARPVTIEVVDGNGAPVPQAEVWTEYRGFTTNTHRIEGNRHLASSVPEAPFVVLARLAGRDYRQEHDPALADARIVVPVHGRAVALVAETATAGRAGQFVLVLAPPQEESARPVTERRASTPGLRIEMPAVHPGTYQASLRYVPSEQEQDAGWEESSSDRVPVTIEANRETEIRLAFPAVGG